ncbi:MAG: hypothetical protein PHU27_10775 [Salinivirgaceae bacterium]|nr:hypothetical protein [Salinivirgaceae bacterium]MDD4747273.1 hypothetical protein [Salinivirgaceae bacterium]MDY0279969.1 hypothetical protein [Salinivirgaceae bacterium]
MYKTPMKQTVILLFLTVALLTGCNSEKEKEALAVIDRKIEIIDSIIQEYHKLPIDSLGHVYKTKLNPTTIFIKNNLISSVKIKQSDIIIISDFTDYVKGLKKIMPLAKQTATRLFELEHQYKTLRTDISKRLIPNDSIDYYINLENESYEFIRMDVNKVLSLKNIGKENLERELKTDSILNILFPQADSL